MKAAFVAVSLAVVGTASWAEEVTTRDELQAYLAKVLTTDKYLTDQYAVGDTFRIFSRDNSCYSARSFKGFPLPIQILISRRAIFFEEVGQSNHGFQMMSSPGCTMKISKFDNTRLVGANLRLDTRSDGTEYVSIPYAKQEFLGMEEVSFDVSYVGDNRCDISFVPWFRNHDPSPFAQNYADELKDDYRLKAVFSEEAKTSRWCLKRKFDGSLEWLNWSRY